jgi:hypothetical protein
MQNMKYQSLTALIFYVNIVMIMVTVYAPIIHDYTRQMKRARVKMIHTLVQIKLRVRTTRREIRK